MNQVRVSQGSTAASSACGDAKRGSEDLPTSVLGRENSVSSSCIILILHKTQRTLAMVLGIKDAEEGEGTAGDEGEAQS